MSSMCIKRTLFSCFLVLASLLLGDTFSLNGHGYSRVNRLYSGETLTESSTNRALVQSSLSKAFKTANGLGIAAAVAVGITPKISYAKDRLVWSQVSLPTSETLFDITFDPSNLSHGWIIGSKETFLETFDAGKTWNVREFPTLDEEDIKYRFQTASLLDNEGWVIGRPAILLHTKDGGKQFERIGLSNKLPGDPNAIFALGSGKAEMITTQGAIYNTVNGGLNWKASVKETIDATLNRVSSSGTSGASYFSGKVANQIRDINGNYLAIGSRGNLFLTWTPGQDYWVPHNRGSSRRIQNMGFILNDATKGLWMTLNGGSLLTTGPNPDLSKIEIEKLFVNSKINTGGYGIIDCAWKDEQNVWAVGGSGIIFESKDGGKSFKFNDNAKDIPGNLYRVKFFTPDMGYALGSNGVLLRFNA